MCRRCFEANEELAALQPRAIVINKEERLWVDSMETSLGNLEPALTEVDRRTPLILRADKHIPLPLFVDVYEAIKHLGCTTLYLQSEQQS